MKDITDSIDKKIEGTSKYEEIIKLETRLNTIWNDSMRKIKKDEEYKKNYDKYKENFIKLIENYKAVKNRFLVKKEKIEIETVAKIMKGSYKGDGETFTYIANWGTVPSGIIYTEINVLENGTVNFADMTSSSGGRWEKFDCKLSTLSNISDTLISGVFKKVDNTICSFSWTPNSLDLSSSNWNSKNKIIK